MTKYRHLNNMKHSLRKARNRVRRLGDSWYNKEFIQKQRSDGKREVKERLRTEVTDLAKTD